VTKGSVMSGPGDLGQLKTLEWHRLQELADRYQESWQEGKSADLERFLPALDNPLRPQVLHELIVVDMEMRWQRGQVVGLEYYVEKYPELGTAPSLPAKLIFEEYHVRHRFGDRPDLSTYQKRFPNQFPALQRLVEKTGRGMTPSPTATPTSAGSGSGVAALNVKGSTLPVAGGYQLINRLGSGSFGEVWRAEAPGGFPAAVKVIFRPIDHEEAQREKEALDLIKGLNHRDLVQTHAYWPLQDRLYIVMELAECSLRDRLNACHNEGLQAVPLPELLTYFRDAAEGLDYLHNQHVLHRDIKPENVLIIQGHAKLADFGLARVQGSRRLATATGVGTPLYMAPEVFRGHVSPRSDLYSLAMAYAELRLGHRLLKGSNLVELMFEHTEGTHDLEPLPQAEQAVIRKAIHKDCEQRYSTCMEWVQALEAAVATEVHPDAPAVGSTVIRPRAPAASDPGPFSSLGRLSDVPTRLPLAEPPQAAPEPVPSGWKPPPPAPPGRSVWPWLLAASLALVALGGGLIAALGLPGRHTNAPVPPVVGTFRIVKPAPLLVATGQTSVLQLHLERENFTGPIRLKVDGLPEGVTVGNIAPEGDGLAVEVNAAKTVHPQFGVLRLKATGGVVQQESFLDMTVMPPGFEPVAQGGTRSADGHTFYDRVARRLPDGSAVEFVAIPRARKGDPDTFYIMVNKVSVGQFHEFLKASSSRATPSWNSEANPDFPVLGVTVTDAYQFAKWLGGNLPTKAEWEKAAGLRDPNGHEGPFRGSWDKEPKPQVAVDRFGKGPMKVGEARDDVNEFGCRDMAGNGQEWTGTVTPGNRRVPLSGKPTPGDYVVLRGRSFEAPGPLLYQESQFGSVLYTETTKDIGFRVVVELE
jgi:serine/threonine protein kinase